MGRFHIIILLFVSIFISACATQMPFMKDDLTIETWQRQVVIDPNRWLQGADNWFINAEPTAAEIANRRAKSGMSMLSLSETNFTGIRANGAFQVQIYGASEDHIALFGPSDAVRQIAVHKARNTLIVQQIQVVPGMKNVIVRIGVRNLNQLIQAGCGSIEAVQIQSNHLMIAATPTSSGNIYLSGKVNLTRVVHLGSGHLFVFNACPPMLDIISAGSGSVNIAGVIGVHSILHNGVGDINIVGANSNGLIIRASGAGKVSIQGVVNLEDVQASGQVCVYVCGVMSHHLSVCALDKARIGLSGATMDLNVDAYNDAVVEGKTLCSQNAFVHTDQHAHINVSASVKTFIAARGQSSVYFFGSPNIISKFVGKEARVLPIWNYIGNSCIAPRSVVIVRHRDYKGELAPHIRRTVGFRINYDR